MCDRRKQSHKVLGISETPKGVTVVVICAVYVTEVLLSTSLHGAVAGDAAHLSSLFISLLLDCLRPGQSLITTWLKHKVLQRLDCSEETCPYLK